MRATGRVTLTAFLSVVMSTTSSRVGEAADAVHGAQLPRNVVLDDSLRDEVAGLAAVSPTIRRQLVAIAVAPVHVEIHVSPTIVTGYSRAESTISRYESGYVNAEVVIPPGADFVELLAHELEHIVEQIEGVDLAALARTGAARRNAAGVYETVRAREAGRAAALEVEEAARALKAVH